MTIFEGMCIGFTAGVVGTLICVLGGALIDKYFNNSEMKGDTDEQGYSYREHDR